MGTDRSDDRECPDREVDLAEASQAEVEAAIRNVEDEDTDAKEFLVGS